jgi:hypothetical protein
MAQLKSVSKGFPLLPLIIALTPVITVFLFLSNFRIGEIFFILWSSFLLCWVLVEMGKIISYALRGKKEPEIAKWKHQITKGGAWYFIVTFVFLIIFLILFAFMAG